MKAVFFALMLAVTASAPALAQSVKITTHEDIVKIGHTPRDLDLVQTNPSRYGSYYITPAVTASAVTAPAPALAQPVKITTYEDIVKIGHTPRDLNLVQTNPSRYGSYYIVK